MVSSSVLPGCARTAHGFVSIQFRSEGSSPETYHPQDPNDLQKVGHIDTRDGWRARRRLLLQKGLVYDRLRPLMEGAKANRLSLAVFKPAQITDFIWESTDREWGGAEFCEI